MNSGYILKFTPQEIEDDEIYKEKIKEIRQ